MAPPGDEEDLVWRKTWALKVLKVTIWSSVAVVQQRLLDFCEMDVST